MYRSGMILSSIDGGVIIRKVELSMDEQKKYEVIKSLMDHPNPNKQRAAYFGELEQMDATPYEWIPGQIWHPL